MHQVRGYKAFFLDFRFSLCFMLLSFFHISRHGFEHKRNITNFPSLDPKLIGDNVVAGGQLLVR